MMETKAFQSDRRSVVKLLIGVVALGSLWGFSEVVLGGAIQTAGLPYRAGILTGIGLGLMGIGVGFFRKPLIPIGGALVAVLCKQLVVPILGVSVMCVANSCVAVMLEGLALAGVVSLAGRKLETGPLAKITSGASAALLAAGGFFFVGMRVAPCRYLLSFDRPGGLVAFLAAEGLVWAAFSAVLFPAGYELGARLRRTAPTFLSERSFYPASAALVLGCWAASALAIAAGF